MTATDNALARMQNVKWLKDNGIEPAKCGIFKLSDKQVCELAVAVAAAVEREGRRAFDAAMGR